MLESARTCQAKLLLSSLLSSMEVLAFGSLQLSSFLSLEMILLLIEPSLRELRQLPLVSAALLQLL